LRGLSFFRYGFRDSASPLYEGERIEVRGWAELAMQNPHPTLSLEKGEAANEFD
jgi:hypothetical protein